MTDWDDSRVLEQLVDGSDTDNALRRLGIILDRIDFDDWNVINLATEPHPIPTSVDDGLPSVNEALFIAAANLIRRIAGFGIDAEALNSLVLPDLSVGRERLWLIFAVTIDSDELVEDVLRRAFGRRAPTSDDIAALDQAETALRAELLSQLPPPPSADALVRALEQKSNIQEVLRQWMWLEVSEADRSDWAEARDVLTAWYGQVGRDTFADAPPRIMSFNVGSPISAADLATLDPLTASATVRDWRLGPNQFSVGYRELARTLQGVVSESVSDWIRSPLDIANTLREPIFIAHYLEGVAKADRALVATGSKSLLAVIQLIDSEPWDPTVLGSSDWDYDPDWNSCRDASVRLLEQLAIADALEGSNYEFSWTYLEKQAFQTNRSSGVVGETDAMSAAINRPGTVAFRGLLQLVGSWHRVRGSTDGRLDEILERALAFEDFLGLQYRAILTPWVPYLRTIVDDSSELERLLYGPDQALRQASFELAVKWARPDESLLTKWKADILELARSDADGAVNHVMIAMLRKFDGYSPRELAAELSDSGLRVVSRGGESLARLLAGDDVPEAMMQTGLEYWDAVLELDSGYQGLFGFGWWADVGGLQEDEWRSRVVASIAKAQGQLAWADRVAERLVLTPNLDTLRCLDLLITAAAEPWVRGRIFELAAPIYRSIPQFGNTEEGRSINHSLALYGLPRMFPASDLEDPIPDS